MTGSSRRGLRARDRLTQAEKHYLMQGVGHPYGHVPLFDQDGQRVSGSLVRSCLDKGLIELWFSNPIKPDWKVCRLTRLGRNLLG